MGPNSWGADHMGHIPKRAVAGKSSTHKSADLNRGYAIVSYWITNFWTFGFHLINLISLFLSQFSAGFVHAGIQPTNKICQLYSNWRSQFRQPFPILSTKRVGWSFLPQEMEEVERAAITSMIEFLVGSPCCLLGGVLWVFDKDEEGLGLHHVSVTRSL